MAIGARLRGILDELIATGYPEQVAERIASGDLPMDTASRMQRAEAMGFDPTDVQYHGGGADITQFKPSQEGMLGPGVYTTSSPVLANEFAGVLPDGRVTGREGGVIYPVLTRGNQENRFSGFRDYVRMNPQVRVSELAEDFAGQRQQAGKTGIDDQLGRQPMRNTFDPRDVRSLFAAFDPEYKGSNILGERAIPVAGAGLLAAAAMSPEEAEAGVLSNLIKAGYPEEVAQRIASGELPMDYASRMERATEQGYSDDIFYKGMYPYDYTKAEEGQLGPVISEINRPSPFPSFGGADGDVDIAGFMSKDPSVASRFSGPNVMRRGAIFPLRTKNNAVGVIDAKGANAGEIQFGESGKPFRDMVRSGDYDSVVIKNTADEGDVYVALDPTNIRSQFAAFDPEYKGSNILGGTAAGALGLTALMAPEEAEAGPVKTAKDLLFLHNTTADKLARQSAMGGMPNPSIAVTQQDVPFSGFGDISLVGKPEAFDPRLRSNPLYSADAYTVRAPSPVRVANKGAYKQFSADFAPYRDAGNIDDVAYSLADLETKTRLEPSDFRRVNDFLEYDNAAALKFADDVGIKLSNKDYHEISQMKRDNADKYREWKDGVLDQYFQTEEFFVTNPDFDRYAGRANLKPYTADNVSRYMTRQAGANKESTMTFGAGNIRASTAERIPSLPKAREMKGLLQPADAVAEVKETASMMLGDLQTALRDYYKYDTSSFRYFDEVGEMIALSERKGMKRAMEEVGFENVPESLVKEIEEYKDYLRSAPTEYFESKPQRAVQLSDFAGAIVPENTSQGVLDMLSRAGLKVEKYGDEATRTEARKKFQDYMFDAAPTIGGGVGLGLLGMPQESVADTAARLRAESDTSGAYAPRSETLQDVTMALRGLERRLEGNPASLLFPGGYVQHLEEFNRPYERSTFTGALLGALDFL